MRNWCGPSHLGASLDDSEVIEGSQVCVSSLIDNRSGLRLGGHLLSTSSHRSFVKFASVRACSHRSTDRPFGYKDIVLPPSPSFFFRTCSKFFPSTTRRSKRVQVLRKVGSRHTTYLRSREQAPHSPRGLQSLDCLATQLVSSRQRRFSGSPHAGTTVRSSWLEPGSWRGFL